MSTFDGNVALQFTAAAAASSFVAPVPAANAIVIRFVPSAQQFPHQAVCQWHNIWQSIVLMAQIKAIWAVLNADVRSAAASLWTFTREHCAICGS